MTKLLPRFIRLRDAPDYLGVDRNRFNAEIRPSLTEIPIGVQGVAFDRLDLDSKPYLMRSSPTVPRISRGVVLSRRLFLSVHN